jgi:hypothetical protein
MTTLLEKILARNVELEKLTGELLLENRILKREKNLFLEQIMILQRENRELKKNDESGEYDEYDAYDKSGEYDAYEKHQDLGQNKKQRTIDDNIVYSIN